MYITLLILFRVVQQIAAMFPVFSKVYEQFSRIKTLQPQMVQTPVSQSSSNSSPISNASISPVQSPIHSIPQNKTQQSTHHEPLLLNDDTLLNGLLQSDINVILNALDEGKQSA